MTSEVWNAAKSLYLEASSAGNGSESFLRQLTDIDAEVVALVRELLSQDPDLLPDLHHACWLGEPQDSSERALEIGRMLAADRFEIVAFLGAGGLGEVYTAFDRQQNEFVALKTLRPALANDQTALSLLRNELVTARRVTHPNVCRLYDLHLPADPETPPFLTMQLLEGETLARYIRDRGPFTPSAAMPIALQIVDALTEAHKRRIVHRDFKSSNVMLTDDGARAVVMDFGLAAEISADAKHEGFAGGVLAGTPAYMAPEQLAGEKATLASDVYSLGVVLFEMATGKRPFEGASVEEILARRSAGGTPSPRVCNARTDRNWEHAIARCLAADPQLRPSIGEVAGLLQFGPVIPWARRRFVRAGAAACVAAGTGAGLLWAHARGRTPESVGIFDVENLTGNPDLDYVAAGTTSELVRRFDSIIDVVAVPMHSAHARPGNDKRRFALSGSVHSGETGQKGFRLSLRIDDTKDRRLVWAQTFARDRFDGLLGMQEQVSNEARAQLRHYLGASGSTVLASAEDWLQSFGAPAAGSTTNSGVAFDLYLRGNSLLQESSQESVRHAIEFFERAVTEDPRFALALAALSEAHLSLLNYGYDFDATLAGKAREYALKALREGGSLAEAHAVMGAVYQVDWQWLAAESEYNQALQLKPKFPRAMRWRAGLLLQFARFDEAVAGFEGAFRDDPYDRSAISGYGMTLMCAGRLREAVGMMTREIGSRDMASSRNNLAFSLGLLAQRAESATEAASLYRKAFEQAQTVAGIEGRLPSASSDMSVKLFAYLHSIRGETDLAAPYLAKLEQDVALRRTSPGSLAVVYTAQKRFDEAENAIQNAVLIRDRFVIYLRVNVLLAELRGRPKFDAQLRTLRLTSL